MIGSYKQLTACIKLRIELPISKSIANRILIREALRGNRISVPSDAPEDVLVMASALTMVDAHPHIQDITTIDIGNCGTAMRFLTAYCAQKDGCNIELTGCERMKQRPIGQLVDILRNVGADITYSGKEGFPPLRIHGKDLQSSINASKQEPLVLNHPDSTQFISALMLVGFQVETNCQSSYISLTNQVLESDSHSLDDVERDWSSAAFWYEDVALHGGCHIFPQLSIQSLQGDKALKEIYAKLGVTTVSNEDGIYIQQEGRASLSTKLEKDDVENQQDNCLTWDFSNCPDLYPAVAITCEQLGIATSFTSIEHLRIKESDRIESVAQKRTNHDHRIAMALLVAGYSIDDALCIKKSYPQFVHQWLENLGISIIIPKRGINDDNKGKKHALHKLISAATTPYVWLTDDDTNIEDVVYSLVCSSQINTLQSLDADLYIMPLQMNGGSSILERLQKIEYKGIQNLTIIAAKKGHAVMCSGANLIVKRERWLESFCDIHSEIPSGDDMFLLESFKRRELNIETLNITLSIQAINTWSAFWKQRMRWAGKAPAYTDKDIKTCGALVIILNLLCIICPLIYIPKYLIELHYLRCQPFVQNENMYTADNGAQIKKDSLLTILLSLCYPWYMLICLVGGMIRKKW